MSVKIKCCCCKGETGNLVFRGLTSVYSDQPWDLAECSVCNNIITLPVPTGGLLNKIYSDTYLYSIHLLVLNEKKFRSRWMAKFVRNISVEKNYNSILEVGCMFGYLLDELKNNFNVKGIEIGEDAISICKKNGLDVQNISIEDYLSHNDEKFDLIILSHVFEHLLSPEKILGQLSNRLKSGGKLIISIPNSNSYNRKLFGRNWGWWQVPVHINHFRESALAEMASNTEMIIEKTRYKGGDSLMLLLNLINLFGFRNNKSNVSFFKKSIIKLFTFFFRYWYFIGNEEITVVMIKK